MAGSLARGGRHGDGRRIGTQSARILRTLERSDVGMTVDAHHREELVAQLLLQREVEALFTKEVELLDERRYDEWLDLFSEDARYWMPIARNVAFDDAASEYTRERT